MPAPQASDMQQKVKTSFRNMGIKLPVDWSDDKAPTQVELEKGDPGDLSSSSNWLFKPQTTMKLHVETAKTKSREFESYIDGICTAICSAWSTWQSAATILGVIVVGPMATGGVVLGVPMTPLILAQGPKSKPQEMLYTKTIATVIGLGWLQYTLTIKVPGLSWYPMFSACPSPFAPPTPNTPCAVSALTQVTTTISKDALKSQMISMHGDPQAQFHKELFEAIADGFEQCFNSWQSQTQVTNVLGMGAVPTMASVPPVPGPVAGGVGLMTPGGFV